MLEIARRFLAARQSSARTLFALWGANLGAMAIGFAIPLAFTRLAPQRVYGEFSFVTAACSTASIFTIPGLTLAITQAASRGFDGTLLQALRLRVTWGIAAVVIILCVAGHYTWRGDRSVALQLAVSAPLMLGAFSLDVASAFANGRQRFSAMMVMLIAAAALPAITVVTLLGIQSAGVVLILGYFGSLSLVNAASLWWVLRTLIRNRSVSSESLGYGMRLSWISSLGAVQFYFDRLVVGATLGFVDLAIYSVAKLFQQGMKATWTAVNQLLFPKLSGRPVDAARGLAHGTLLAVWIGFAALTIAGLILAPRVVHLLFGAKYDASVLPARVLLVAMFVGIPGAQFELLSRAIADERRLYTQRIIFSVAEIVLTGIGALKAGVFGASVGTLCAYAINSASGFLLDARR